MKKLIPIWKITLFISLFITLFGNFSFWKNLNSRVSFLEDPVLSISFFIIILIITNLLLTLFSFKSIFKITAILVLISSSFAAYFMDSYAVMIDKGMIKNVLLSDFNEASELFSIELLITVLLMGVIPSWLLFKVRIDYQTVLKGLFQKTIITVISLIIITTTLYSSYQDLSFFGRNNRELRHLINPTNYIFSLKSVISNSFKETNIVVKPIEKDAKMSLLSVNRKPSLVILVLGETARAMNLSLNGYSRNTNPLLSKQRIINFNDVSSCGTATAVSVPCMFSKFPRTDFSESKGKQFENLLDVVKHAGYQVLWRDNNTGCQGNCERIEYEDLAHKEIVKFCSGGNCVDEILLDDLQTIVDSKNGDRLIILHQKGNHGPTYHRRYPKEFEVFKPVCKTNQLRSCSQQEVLNAYDNAILYSDYFLSKTIDFLKTNSQKYNTAMVYISDHGESLGENNLYLHGLPYMIAPKEQKKVPLIVWLSKSYQQVHGIDKSCVAKKSSSKLSHDNLFSSVLGMLSVQTEVLDSELDIFSSCKRSFLVKKQ